MRNRDEFELRLDGPFNLRNQNRYFGGWPEIEGAVAMAFPVEGWSASAAVLLRQSDDKITGRVYGASSHADKAWSQAMAALSLDVDGTGYAQVGRRDPAIGALQEQYEYLRPTLFHSPYESAAGFLIGHRISIKQARKIRQEMAEQGGAVVNAETANLRAFPDPQRLLHLDAYPGLSATKIERLRAIARAALEGWLDRDNLRAMPVEEALEKLQTLPGVGPFFAQGILMRGAGLTDSFPDDDLTVRAVKSLYGLPESAGLADVLARAEVWRPFRMWCSVLLHVWYRGQPGVTQGLRGGGREAAGRAGRARPRG